MQDKSRDKMILGQLGPNTKYLELSQFHREDTAKKMKSICEGLEASPKDFESLIVFGPALFPYPLSQDEALLLASALTQNTSLRQLTLFRIRMGDEGVAFVSHLQGKRWTRIAFYNCDVNARGCEVISQKLVRNNTLLTELVLGVGYLHRNNGIGDAGCITLAEALRGNSTLKKLELRFNEITSQGCASLCTSFLQGNTSLQTLDIGGNKIGNEGFVALVRALKQNTSLVKLRLQNTGAQEVDCEQICELLLAKHMRLKELDLHCNAVGDGGCVMLASALKENHTLEKLDLSDVSLTGCCREASGELCCGVCALVTALTVNHTLSTLDIRHNPVSVFPVEPWLHPSTIRAKLTCTVKLNLYELRYPPRRHLVTVDAFNEFLRDLRTDCTYADTLNISIVGHSGVGKTTLTQRVLLDESLLSRDIGSWTCEEVLRWCRIRNVPPAIRSVLRDLYVNGDMLQSAGFKHILKTCVAEKHLDIPLSAIYKFCNQVTEFVSDHVRVDTSSSDTSTYISTIGVDVSEATFALPWPSGNTNDMAVVHPRKLRASVLDFAGQIEYYASHQMFLGHALSVYVVMGRVCMDNGDPCLSKFDESVEHWLRFLATLTRTTVRVPILIVATCFDLLSTEAQLSMAAIIDQKMKAWKTRFSNYLDMRSSPHWLPLNYRDKNSVYRVRKAIQTRLRSLSLRNIIPSSFAAARHALDTFLQMSHIPDDSAATSVSTHTPQIRVSQLLLSLDECAVAIRRHSPEGVFSVDDSFLISRALQYLEDTAEVFRHSCIPDAVVLRPLQWFASTVASFVPASRHTRNLLLETITDELAQPQFEQVRQHEMPGFLPWEVLQKQHSLLGCESTDKLLQVLQYLAAINFVHLVWVSRRAGQKRTASSRDTELGAMTPKLKGVWVPTLLSCHDPDVVAKLWETYTVCNDGGSVWSPVQFMGRRVCVSADMVVPPALFPQFLVALLREGVCSAPREAVYMDARFCSWQHNATSVFVYLDIPRCSVVCVCVGSDAHRLLDSITECLVTLTASCNNTVFGYEALCYHCLSQHFFNRLCGSVQLSLYRCPNHYRWYSFNDTRCMNKRRSVFLSSRASPDPKCPDCKSDLEQVVTMRSKPRQSPTPATEQGGALHCTECKLEIQPSILLKGMLGAKELICRRQHALGCHVFPRPDHPREKWRCSWQVFLSHRGPDTKQTIAHPLKYLIERSINDVSRTTCFLDESIESIPDGAPIESEIGHGLYGCRVGVVLLSGGFLSSKWCCKEVNSLLNRSRDEPPTSFSLLPVFVDSELSVRPEFQCMSHLPKCERGDVRVRTFLITKLVPFVIGALGADYRVPDLSTLSQWLDEYICHTSREKPVPGCLYQPSSVQSLRN